MPFVIAYANLLFAHFLADFPLQGDFLAQWKSKSHYIMLVHVSIWTGVVSWMLYFLQGDLPIWKPVFLFLGHWAMDAWKCKGYYKKFNMSDQASLMVDQAWHAAQLLVVLGL